MITLYRKRASGRIEVYTFEIDGGRTRIHHGTLGKPLRTSRWKAFDPTQHRSEVSVAKKRVEGMVRLMIAERGWTDNLESLGALNLFKPMLASPWDPRACDRFRNPVYVQPFVSGLRVLVSDSGIRDQAGRLITKAERVWNTLKSGLFVKHPDLVLDGVLRGWEHDFPESDFYEKDLPVDQLVQLDECLELHVFDAADGAGFVPFNLRHGFFAPLIEELHLMGYPVKLVEATAVKSIEDTDDAAQYFLAKGWDGCVVRTSPPGSVYREGLSRHALLRREFYQRDFTIVKVEEGLGPLRGQVEKVLLKTPDLRGRFKAPVGASREDKREAWSNRHILAGGKATVKFQRVNKNGIPSNPVVVTLTPLERCSVSPD